MPENEPYSIAEAGGHTWHMPGADGSPLCGTPIDHITRRYLTAALAPDDVVCNRCAALWRQGTPAVGATGASHAFWDEQNRVADLLDELAGLLAVMPAAEQRSWLVGLFVRLNQAGGDVFDQVLDGVWHELQDRAALGRWAETGTGRERDAAVKGADPSQQ